MKVKELKLLLEQCDPEAEAIFNAPFQGFKPITVIHRRAEQGSIAGRMSFEKIPTVDVTNGNLDHMLSQDLDVLGAA